MVPGRQGSEHRSGGPPPRSPGLELPGAPSEPPGRVSLRTGGGTQRHLPSGSPLSPTSPVTIRSPGCRCPRGPVQCPPPQRARGRLCCRSTARRPVRDLARRRLGASVTLSPAACPPGTAAPAGSEGRLFLGERGCQGPLLLSSRGPGGALGTGVPVASQPSQSSPPPATRFKKQQTGIRGSQRLRVGGPSPPASPLGSVPPTLK